MHKVMFLCTGNSCRSQMAEGFAKDLGRGIVEAHSAGLCPAGYVYPKAIEVMKEAGVDISGQKSKAVDPDFLKTMDLVITLCSNAEATCPTTPPGIRSLHWPIVDPVGATGTDEEIMTEFRRARDEIRERILAFLETPKEMKQ
ncbi:MAG: arsenate reductase ArsC [Nitrospiraceae bacterium]|nr:arsenate reductase ArsC [Nitrospiraceae bacterium]